MSGHYSLRRRLGLGIAGGVVVAWLGGMIVAGLAIRHELDEAFDSALQETAQRLLSLAATTLLDSQADARARQIPALKPHDEYLTYLVRDRDGNVLMQSHDAELRNFPARPKGGFTTTHSHRIYGEAAVSGTLFIEVAEPLKHRLEATLESTLSLAAPLALFLPLLAVGVWWVVHVSVRPLVDFRGEIEARGEGDLSPVSGAGLPDEVRPIADAVTRLLGRLKNSLEAERTFTSNSAHELRTPIAGALAQTQRLLATPLTDETAVKVRQIEAALHRLARISEKLMQLARAEGGGLLAEAPADLRPIFDAVVDEFRRDAIDGGRLRTGEAASAYLVSRIDPDAFGILLRNLIENALKHSPAGSPVSVSITGDGVVRVVNEGPIVPAERLARLTQRFERGGAENDGSGLGLAIAKAIADGASSSLELRSPASGGNSGFEAVIRLAS